MPAKPGTEISTGASLNVLPLKLYTLIGAEVESVKLIRSGGALEYSLDLSTLNQGTYLLNITTRDAEVTTRVIVEAN